MLFGPQVFVTSREGRSRNCLFNCRNQKGEKPPSTLTELGGCSTSLFEGDALEKRGYVELWSRMHFSCFERGLLLLRGGFSWLCFGSNIEGLLMQSSNKYSLIALFFIVNA